MLIVNNPYVPFTIVTATSSVKTPAASNNYHSLTTNSVSLTAGTWLLSGYANFGNGGTTPTYTDAGLGFYGANGADSSSAPATTLAGVSGITVNSAYGGGNATYINTASNFSVMTLPAPSAVVTLTSTQSIFIVTYAVMTTAANARITTYLNATRLY